MGGIPRTQAGGSRPTSVAMAQLVDAPRSVLGEGPRWFGGRLTWVDVTGGRIHRLDPVSGDVQTDVIGRAVSLVVPRARGGELRAIDATVVLHDPDGTGRVLAVLDSDDDMRCNDGACGPDGSLFIGTMRRDGSGRDGRLFRVESDGSVEVLLRGLAVSNGIGFDATGERAYFIDSMDRRIDILHLAKGSREPFIEIDHPTALPDGLAVDAEGEVWVALFAGGQVRRYRTNGALDAVFELPATQVTSCTFGGDALRDLYVTTAQEDLSPDQLEQQPAAGSLFRIPNVGQGRAIDAFAG